MKQQPANYINHIALVLDASGSMDHLTREVIAVADNQIKYLAQRSQELDQETRATVYTFDYYDNIQCIFYDKDVLRMPSISGFYRPDGQTALLDATIKALADLEKTAQLYGDHAFLTYVLTDGQENNSKARPRDMSTVIQNLPDNWTLAAFVPDQNGVFEAKKFGFAPENISVWNTNARGMNEVGERIRQATDVFMVGRANGVRTYKNLFTLDTAKLTKSVVSGSLDKLHRGQFRLLPVKSPMQIATFVERELGRAYRVGEAYYQLTKKEEVQPQKQVALFDRRQASLYRGAEARKLLGLPDYNVKISPENFSDYDIFIQSTSVNRKLVPGTNVLVL